MVDAKPDIVILPGGNPWSSYMPDVYRGRIGPQPLGTVVFEEIEAKAKEKLKDHGGERSYTESCSSLDDGARCLYVRWWKRWHQRDLSRQFEGFREVGDHPSDVGRRHDTVSRSDCSVVSY